MPFKKTGNTDVDKLISKGEVAIGEMMRIRSSLSSVQTVSSERTRSKIFDIILLVDEIFQDLYDDPSDLPQVRRFAEYYLPVTIKLLNSYSIMSSQSTYTAYTNEILARMDNVLDLTIKAYQKQLDALLFNQVLDIESDIEVLKSMLQRDSLGANDF